MARKDERWLNQTGLNLIRIVIGSYFMAVSLDLVIGIDQTALFVPFMPFQVADLVGSTLLFVVSIAFMLGIRLRPTALVLALFVFCSSLMQNFLIAEFEDISAFWRDVTMVCAIILNYSNMNRREIRSADLIRRRRRVARIRKITMPGAEVTPRRVAPPGLAKPATAKPAEPKPAEPKLAALKPAAENPASTRPAPRSTRPRLELPAFMRHPDQRDSRRDMMDINLFANI